MPLDEESQRRTTYIPKLFNILDVSLVIPNKVTMARDQLASERNFLSFTRFSCTLIVLGFTMLLKFRLPYETDATDDDNNSSGDPDALTTPLGYCFIAIGFCLFLYGFFRYYMIQRALAQQINIIQAGWFSMSVMATLASFVIGVMILASVQSAMFTPPT